MDTSQLHCFQVIVSESVVECHDRLMCELKVKQTDEHLLSNALKCPKSYHMNHFIINRENIQTYNLANCGI